MSYFYVPRAISGLGACCSSCAHGGPCSGLGDDTDDQNVDTQENSQSIDPGPLDSLTQSMGPDILEDPVKAGITGAVAGATVGSVVGPIGTLIGAVVGGAAGAGAGLILGKKAKTKRKRAQRAINQAAFAEQDRIRQENARIQSQINALAQKRRAVLALESSAETKATFLAKRNESAADLLAELADIKEQVAEADSSTLDTLRGQISEIVGTLNQIARNPSGLGSELGDISLGTWLDDVRQKNRLAAGLPAGRRRNLAGLGQDNPTANLMAAKTNQVADLIKVAGVGILGYFVYQAWKDE